MAEQPQAASLKRRVRRKTRFLPAILLLALTVAGGWYAWVKTHPAEDENSKLLTATVTRGDLLETVSSTGSITAQTGAQVKIGSQITGIIRRLYADVGAQVKAGQVIAELDLPDIQAQVSQAEANLAAARVRLAQQQDGYAMQQAQSENAVAQAVAELNRAQSRLDAARANAQQQIAQTPTNVRRAETALGVAKAGLSTARATLQQTQASADLQVATAEEQLKQAQATAENNTLNLTRQRDLLKKGFVAASVVDTAEAADKVSRSQVSAAQQNVRLVKAQVAANLQLAKNQVAEAQENVASAEAALDSARAGTLQDKVRQADVTDALAQVRQAQVAHKTAVANLAQIQLKSQDIRQAQEAVRVSEAQVAIAKAQFNKTFIRSPISGTVLQMASQQGETLAAGLSAPTVIIVADLNRLQVDVFVDETDIGKIKIGQEAEIRVDAYPGKAIKGRVSKIASGSTIQQGVITYDVTIALEDTFGYQLKPDMTAGVTLITGKRENVLLVPTESVKVGVRGSTVNVLTGKAPEAKPESRKVKAGASDGVNTEIIEGVQEGETIVLAGMEDGRRRRPTNSPFGPSEKGGGGKGGGGGGGKGGRM